MKLLKLSVLSLFISAVFISTASANIEQLKVYRKVFPDLKPKCSYCHIDEKPKKEDGKHELNAYGLKLKELMADRDLTEEMVKSAGSHEEFKAQDAAVTEVTDKVSQEEESQKKN